MKELSLNILDITENSVKAGATLTEIKVNEDNDSLVITISDNGCGMPPDVVESVTNPFYTTRTTRKVGMGIPLFKLAAEQTGGSLTISSKTKEDHPEKHGTVLVARFNKNHIDFTPLGDLVSTVQTLIQGHPDVDFLFIHEKNGGRVELDTREVRAVLEDIPLNSYDVIKWIGDELTEQYGAAFDFDF